MSWVLLGLLLTLLVLQVATLKALADCKRLIGRLDFELEQARKTGRL